MLRKILFIVGACIFSLLAEAQLKYVGKIDKSDPSPTGYYSEKESPRPIAYYNNPTEAILAFAKADTKTLTFYKSDFSVAQRLICAVGYIPDFTQFVQFGYVEDAVNGDFCASQHLFNDDDRFEFIVWVMATDNKYHFCVYNDEMECLFISKESFYVIRKITLQTTSEGLLLCVGDDLREPYYYVFGSQEEIPDTPDTPDNPDTPGTPTMTGAQGKKLLTLSHSYPNPATDYINLPYELSENTTSGIIRIYNIQGQLMQSLVVDGTFDYVRVNTSDFPVGNYLYQLDVNGKLSDEKQFVVMR